MVKTIQDFIDTHRWQLLIIPWGFTLLIIVGSLAPGSAVKPVFVVSDKLIHAVSYAIVFISFSPFYFYKFYPVIVLRLMVMGVLIEVLQGVSGLRSFDAYDMLANTVGLLLSWLVIRCLIGVGIKPKH